MPSIEANVARWAEGGYHWADGGDEWSAPWGGPAMQWYSTFLPRLHAFLPTRDILEIAPGYGRWTQFFKNYCEKLTIVDLGPACIEHCQNRFRECSHIEYHVNDGKALDMLLDDSIDCVVSFDSLVHAERDVIDAYLSQLPRILRKDGVGILHHSNFADCGETVNRHWRAASMSAALFAELCDEHGMQCVAQELVNWGSQYLTDCFSVFTPAGSVWSRENRVVHNDRFHEEAARAKAMAAAYVFEGR